MTQDKEAVTAENVIYTVLRQRHMKEAVNLEEQLEREREARLAEERALVAERRADERDKLQGAYEQVNIVGTPWTGRCCGHPVYMLLLYVTR